MKKLKPNTKQKKAFLEVIAKGSDVKHAMIKAGYSPMTAHNPSKLTESQGWKQLMEEYLPRQELAAAHKKLLNITAVQHISFPAVLNDKEIQSLIQDQGGQVKKIKRMLGVAHVWYFVPDGYALKGGLDMAYKLNGSYAPVKVQETSPYETMSDEEILQELESIQRFRQAQKALSDSKRGKKMKGH
jgi:hypothetical protein